MHRVLVVEDETLIRELAAEDFADAGFHVTTACSGEEALKIVQAGSDFDLLFTDIRMPGDIDGWELARRARQLLPALRVIYASGFDDTDNQLSDEGFIRKPYMFDEVTTMLERFGLA
jgi:CheY-like chemotaxis protein